MPDKEITKAIIPVAGWGTRRLPVAKAIEKCMLPICNRPIIDYCVEQCVSAGIEDIFFVVSPDFEQLRSYYTANVPLEEYLAKRGKHDTLQTIQSIPRKANFHYVVQDPSGPYGTSVPLWIARDAIRKGENFVLMFGDGFVYRKDGANEIAHLLEAVTNEPVDGAMLGIEMNDTDLAKCAAIKTKPGTHNFSLLEELVEKPAPGTAPSNLANVSCYVLPSSIMPFVEHTLIEPNAQGEHYLTDAVTMFADQNSVAVVPSTGQFLDGGELEGWVKANNIMLEALAKTP